MDIILNLLKVLTKWKPDWLYEVMPFLYLATGLATMLHFDSTVGYVSGALLLAAVTCIWVLRLQHRSFRRTTG